jgi:hypothetical protein
VVTLSFDYVRAGSATGYFGQHLNHFLGPFDRCHRLWRQLGFAAIGA